MKKLLSVFTCFALAAALFTVTGCTDTKKTEDKTKKVETKTETKDGKTTETKKEEVKTDTKTETKKDK